MDTDFKQNCHSFSLREEGALLVRAHFRYPTSSQWELYRELAENAELLAEKKAAEAEADAAAAAEQAAIDAEMAPYIVKSI